MAWPPARPFTDFKSPLPLITRPVSSWRSGWRLLKADPTDADTQLDIDGHSESKPLTGDLLLIRYLFGFSGDSLISGAIGSDATRDTADAIDRTFREKPEVYLKIVASISPKQYEIAQADSVGSYLIEFV